MCLMSESPPLIDVSYCILQISSYSKGNGIFFANRYLRAASIFWPKEKRRLPLKAAGVRICCYFFSVGSSVTAGLGSSTPFIFTS